MKNSTLSQEVTQLHADICSAIAEPQRILLLYAIVEQERNVSELGEAIGISQPSASRHLKILRERGLVEAKRSGSNVVYSLTDRRLIEALDLLREIMNDRITYRASLVEN